MTMMCRGISRVLLWGSLCLLLKACGLQVRQEVFSQSIGNNNNAFKVHVSGLSLGETVYLRYKLNVENFDDNTTYDFPYDGEAFNENDFSIVSSPCLKQCDLDYVSSPFVNILPELY